MGENALESNKSPQQKSTIINIQLFIQFSMKETGLCPSDSSTNVLPT